MGYKHGTYGDITNSKVASIAQSATVAAYVGTAAINLIRGYKNADLINTPIKLTNMNEAVSKLGKASDWNSFTLCEAFAQHFEVQNSGPIFVVNVLNPEIHKKGEKTSVSLNVANKRAEFESSTIILDSFAIEVELISAFSAKSFFNMSLSINNFHNFL